jgi:hypothetical protein
MARRPTLEEQLDRLAELRSEPDVEVVRREALRALEGRSHLVAAKGAQRIGERGLIDAVPELLSAFDRFLVDPVEHDKGCVAKTAIARALLELEAREADGVFLRGVRHVQKEGAYGGPQDTAVELRAVCAHGLAVSRHPDAVYELVDLLVDPEPPARAAAARALGISGRVEAEALLRLAVRAGEAEPEVLAECFGALLELAPDRSLGFVAGFLSAGDEAATAAALALGESRLEGAVAALREAYGSCAVAELGDTFLLALSMTRRGPAFDFLLGRIARGSGRDAAGALRALALHHHDDALRRRVEEALDERGASAELRAVYDREFGP